jgi:hypothetical protein
MSSTMYWRQGRFGLEVKFRSESLSERVFLLSSGPLLDEQKVSVGSIVTLTAEP